MKPKLKDDRIVQSLMKVTFHEIVIITYHYRCSFVYSSSWKTGWCSVQAIPITRTIFNSCYYMQSCIVGIVDHRILPKAKCQILQDRKEIGGSALWLRLAAKFHGCYLSCVTPCQQVLWKQDTFIIIVQIQWYVVISLLEYPGYKVLIVNHFHSLKVIGMQLIKESHTHFYSFDQMSV